MEYVQTALASTEVVMSISWSCISECVNYKKILNEKMRTLEGKMAKLRSQEEDINIVLGNAEYLGGKKQKKKEVETWLKNVQDKRSEVQDMEHKFGKKNYFSRSRFLRLVEKNIQEVDELIEKGRFPEGPLIDVHRDREEALLTTPLVGQSIKDRNLRKIWECLMDDGITSIGVYGMGGIGKTTIVTHIHNQLLESTSTFDHVYWVTVSHESSTHKLQDEIAKIIWLDLSDEQDERKRAAKLFKELTRRKKFVLILDDIWQVFPLENVGIPIGAGKLIVTTRSLEVCRRMNCQKIIKVMPLSMKESWDLFVEKLKPETVLAPEVEEIAKSIAEECAGLPLAIITTAGSMRGVDEIWEWRNALNELRDCTKGIIDMEGEVFQLLKFSYDRLNDEKLQHCLLYCALFPEDYKIQRRYLIVRWIGEGLVDEMKTRRAEFDRGHALLNKLENVCLLERTTNFDEEICVKMHDIIRDMALNITRVNPQFMVKAGVKLKELPDEREWSENLDRVSLMHNDLQGQLSCISPKCPKLLTLMLQSNFFLELIPNSLFVYMQNLRVLDMSDLMVRTLPDSISGLVKLRVLLLNNCQNLRYVASLAKLTELRELDLCLTQILELPHGMEKLVNLKRLGLSHCTGDDCMPLVFPSGLLLNLSHLQCLDLSMFEISDDVHVEEIITLRQLEVLVVDFSNLDVFNSYVESQHWQILSHYCFQTMGIHGRVFDIVHCRQVEMRICSPIQGGVDPIFLPANIQELRISSCHDLTSLSDITSSLTNARELERCWIQSCNGIEQLWSWTVPSLEKETDWCTNTNSSLLQSLRTLELDDLGNLRVLFNFKGAGVRGAPPKFGTFSNLKLFSIGMCPKLKYLFTQGLVQHYLQNLEVIHVYECSEMENIIVTEEEERIVAAEEEEITFPKLRSLELDNLPKLKSIWKGTMVCHSLQQILVQICPMLQRLPFSLHSQTSSTLKKIWGNQNWWDLLEWDYPAVKSIFQPLFEHLKEFSRVTGYYRAVELWKKDKQRYEK